MPVWLEQSAWSILACPVAPCHIGTACQSWACGLLHSLPVCQKGHISRLTKKVSSSLDTTMAQILPK